MADPKEKERKDRATEDRRVDKLLKSIKLPKARGGDFDTQMQGVGRSRTRYAKRRTA